MTTEAFTAAPSYPSAELGVYSAPAGDGPSGLTPAQCTPADIGVKCVHHWLIAPPNGATSQGVCIKCNAERTFSNSSPEYTITERKQVIATSQYREFYSDLPAASLGKWV